MASAKNSSRSKRKYGDARKAATLRNKAKKDAKKDRLVARTQKLIGRKVKIKRLEGDETGIIKDVVNPPENTKRSGRFLKIETPNRTYERARSRTKILPEI